MFQREWLPERIIASAKASSYGSFSRSLSDKTVDTIICGEHRWSQCEVGRISVNGL